MFGVDLRDVPVLGRFAVLGGSVLDLLANSGDLVFVLVDVVLSNVEMIATMLRILESLAKRIPYLPAGVFGDLLTVALVALLVMELLRFGSAVLSQS